MKITLKSCWHRFPKAAPGATLDVDAGTAREAIQRQIAVAADAEARTAAETAEDLIDSLEQQVAEDGKTIAAQQVLIDGLTEEVAQLKAQLAAAPPAPPAEPAGEETGKGKAKK